MFIERTKSSRHLMNRNNQVQAAFPYGAKAAYAASGRLTKDLNKKISGIQYN